MKTPPAPRSFQRSPDPKHGWEILIAGDLSDKQQELLDRVMEVPPCSRGTIYFDSCGGSAYTGISLAALICLRGLKATAVVLGECSSAALLPFAACHERYVLPQSSLYFHPVRWSSEENVKLEEAAEWTRHFGVLEVDMDRVLARMFDVPFDTLVSWTRPGRFFTGEEIVGMRLAKGVDLFAGDLRRQVRS